MKCVGDAKLKGTVKWKNISEEGHNVEEQSNGEQAETQ